MDKKDLKPSPIFSEMEDWKYAGCRDTTEEGKNK
jgi:hypothetical protein